MKLPTPWPVEPMLAKSVPEIPDPASISGGLAYEPKWDGFRVLIARDGDAVELASRGGKTLNRYFPEVVEMVRAAAPARLPARCVIDSELVVRTGEPRAQRLDWEALSARIHPAESRIAKLSAETPAELICFDLLGIGDEDLMASPFRERRARLADALSEAPDGIHLTGLTEDVDLARTWFTQFEGAGLDGLIAKPWTGRYEPGKRTMLKIKHSRTAEAVLVGYRVHKSGEGVGSLLLGLYDADGRLLPVGGISAFTTARREELVQELEPLVVRDDEGQVVAAERERTRFSSGKDTSYVPLRPERVVEVAFDQLEGHRFRHAARFLRWRPDRDPATARLDQVDRAPAYDLGDVLD